MSLLDELALNTKELAAHYRELPPLVIQEKQARLSAYQHSTATAHNAKETEASFAAFPITEEILRIKGEIDALLIERDLIHTQIRCQQTT